MNGEQTTKSGRLEVGIPVKVASSSTGIETTASPVQEELDRDSLPVGAPGVFVEPVESLPNKDTTAPGWLARFAFRLKESWEIIKGEWKK